MNQHVFVNKIFFAGDHLMFLNDEGDTDIVVIPEEWMGGEVPPIDGRVCGLLFGSAKFTDWKLCGIRPVDIISIHRNGECIWMITEQDKIEADLETNT